MTPVKQPPRPPPPKADQLAEAIPEEIGEAPVKKDNPIGVSYNSHSIHSPALLCCVIVRSSSADSRGVQMGREGQPVGVSGTRDGTHDEINGQIHKVSYITLATSSSNGMRCIEEKAASYNQKQNSSTPPVSWPSKPISSST